MKNSIKVLPFFFLFLVLPFFSKAQKGGGVGAINMTVDYIDPYGSYGYLRCTPSNNYYSYPYDIPSYFSHTYTGTVPSGATSNYWTYLTLSSVSGNWYLSLDVQATLEAQTIGTDYYYYPSNSGNIPVYKIKRNASYDYTITAFP